MKFKDVIVSEQWSQKYKNSINCSHPKGFSQKAHCAGKKKHNESIEMEMVCEDCGMCQTHGNINEIKKGQKDSNGYTRCWPGKHAEGTKKGKNGGQVRNCVPNESVAESSQRVDSLVTDALKLMRGPEANDAVSALKTVLGDREYNQRRGYYNFYVRQMLDMYGQQGVTEGKDIDARISNLKDAIRSETPRSVPGEDHKEQYARHAEKIAGYKAELKKLMAQKKQGVAEDLSRRGFLKGLGAAVAGAAGLGAANAGTDDPEYNRKVQQQHQEMMEKNPHYAKEHADLNIVIVRGISGQSAENNKRWYQKTAQLLQKYGVRVNEGVAEDYDSGEYNDEAGMAQGNLHTIAMAAQGLLDTIDDKDNLPEWAQEKIAKVEGMLVTVWNYLQSQEAQGIDPEVEEMYEAMDQLAEEMAAKKGVSADLVWETFEAMDDHMLYETAAWRRKEGKSKSGGLNAKGVASYRREHPGSKLQTAVTTKPSKLKPGSKAAKRRKSFCARMSGVKGPMKKPNGKPTRKALALRKWNC